MNNRLSRSMVGLLQSVLKAVTGGLALWLKTAQSAWEVRDSIPGR